MINEELVGAIDCACRDLPEGYTVTINLEGGAAYVELITPDGIISIDEGGYLVDEINTAVVWAINDVGVDVDEDLEDEQ